MCLPRSVIMYASMVAILGSIIPAPLAIPTTDHPFFETLDRTLGYLSVVVMPRAAGYALLLCSCAAASGIPPLRESTGRRHPIIPVEEGNTNDFDFNLRAVATASQRLSLSPAPAVIEGFGCNTAQIKYNDWYDTSVSHTPGTNI